MAERIALLNLGCPKNLVDAEVMLGHLRAEGFELTGDMDDADVVVVNTCGFLEASAQESVDALLEAAERKKSGRLRAVVAAGCMTQRYGGSVAEAMPEVDGFLGVGQGSELPAVVRSALAGERPTRLRGPSAGFEGYGLRLHSSGPTAYVKVSEGCDRHCAFCVIPSIRGPMVSRPEDAVLREAQALAAAGVRELVLVGQDPTRYGVDLPGGGHRLPGLLEKLSGLDELRWIRLMYLFPDRHAHQVVEAVAQLPRLCRYVDMPFQHASPALLRRMNRPGGAEEYLALIDRARRLCPKIALRSSFIVGHPGETEEDFQVLLAFLAAARLDWVGTFEYSPEEGSPAAEMAGAVPPEVRRERYDQLMTLQQRITRERLRSRRGSTVEVLLESVDGPVGRGRTGGQAPEVDGDTTVDLRGLPGCRPGDFVQAKVMGSGDYELEARAQKLFHRPERPGPSLIQIGGAGAPAPALT